MSGFSGGSGSGDGGELTTVQESFVSAIAGLSYVTGDLVYYSGSAIGRLPIGSNGQVLSITSGVPTWVATTSVGSGITLPTSSTDSALVLWNGTGGTILKDSTVLLSATAMRPSVNDAIALGTTSLMFSDLFLASGSVVNFNAGDVTITHASNLLTFAGGNFAFSGRILKTQGADVASANDLTLGVDGNAFEITGTTQINAITSANWQNGAMFTLIFNASVTVKHNTAGGAGTIKLLLAGAADFSATQDDTLTLMLCENTAGGQLFREIARSAI